MDDKEIKNVISKALDTQNLEYEPNDRTKENEVLIARFSAPNKQKRKFIRVAYICASAVAVVLVTVISLVLAFREQIPPPPTGGHESVEITNVKEQYPYLLYPSDDFNLIKCVLHKKDKISYFIVCDYEASDYEMTVIVTFNSYIHESDQSFLDICTNETKILGINVRYGENSNDAYAIFDVQDNIYLVTLYSASNEQILSVLNNFS